MTNKTINLEKEFEDKFERCLNDYWFSLTLLEKSRYLDFFRQKFQQLIDENEPEKEVWSKDWTAGRDFNRGIKTYKEKLLKAIKH